MIYFNRENGKFEEVEEKDEWEVGGLEPLFEPRKKGDGSKYDEELDFVESMVEKGVVDDQRVYLHRPFDKNSRSTLRDLIYDRIDKEDYIMCSEKISDEEKEEKGLDTDEDLYQVWVYDREKSDRSSPLD